MDHYGTSVVAVAEEVGKSEVEELLCCSLQVRARNVLDIVALFVRALRLWVVSSWTLSQTAIVSSPSSVALATLELVSAPKITPCINVNVARWKIAVSCRRSVVVGNVVVHADAMATATIWAGGASATHSCETWEALAYARLEVAGSATTALAIRVLIVEGGTSAGACISCVRKPRRFAWGEAVGAASKCNSFGTETLFATNAGVSFVAYPFFLDGIVLGVGCKQRLCPETVAFTSGTDGFTPSKSSGLSYTTDADMPFRYGKTCL